MNKRFIIVLLIIGYNYFLKGQCTISTSGLAEISCDDNGTSSNPSDDYIKFELNPTGSNLGSSYTVTVPSGYTINPSGGDYGTTTEFDLQVGSAGGGDVNITLTDSADASCTLDDETVTDPGTCSCDIDGINIENLTCANNNNDINFNLTVESSYAGNYSISMQNGTPVPDIGTYNNLINLTVEGIDPSQVNIITITDALNSQCFLTMDVNSLEIPNVTIMGPQNACEEVEITLQADAGSGSYSYYWSTTETTESIDVTPTTINNTFSVDVTDNGNFCIASDDISINVFDSLTLTSDIMNVDCFNNSTGVIDLTVMGGDGMYTYDWSNGGSTASISGLTAGTYTVIVTDNSNCSDLTETFIITQPPALECTAEQNIPATCNMANGEASVSASGGTPNYTFAWSNGKQSGTMATGLSAGTYTVIVTDANNCQSSCTVDITGVGVPTCSTIKEDVSCKDGTDGSIDLTAMGGTPGYTYDWADLPGNNDPEDRDNLMAGTYTVTVRDAIGCTTVCTETIQEPSLLVCSTTKEDVSCKGGNDGSIDLMPVGGTPGYTYDWADLSGPNEPQDRDNLTAGTYTVTVIDANNCTTVCTAIIQEPMLALTCSTTKEDVSCKGGNDGSIDLMPVGGTPGYTYDWADLSGPNEPQDRDNLSAGTFTVTVTDINGCTTVCTETILEPALGVTCSTTKVDVSCKGGNNGSIDLTASGGTPGYTYNWADLPGNNNPKDRDNLMAGTYIVIVTDVNDCTTTCEVEISEPPLLVCSTTKVDVSCKGGNDGSIELTADGGTLGYTYDWLDIPGNTNTEDRDNLMAGTYTVTVTDANNCTTICSVMITEPPALICSTTKLKDVSCYGGSDGRASVTVTGGTPGYIYEWDNGETSSTAIMLDEGRHYITVTDTKDCERICSVVIDQPSELMPMVNAIDESCLDADDGMITFINNGGTPPYSTSLNGQNSMIGNTGTYDDLTPGSYELIITDNNGCNKAFNSDISTGTEVNVFINPFMGEETCDLGQDLLFNFTGNATNYDWFINDILQNDPNILKLGDDVNEGPGQYVVKLKGELQSSTQTALTCTAESSLTAVIWANPEITDLIEPVNNQLCKNASGTVSIEDIVDDDFGDNFTYEWDVNGTILNTPSISIPSDDPSTNIMYSVTVTDSHNCIDTESGSTFINDNPISDFMLETPFNPLFYTNEFDLINTSIESDDANNTNYQWCIEPENDINLNGNDLNDKDLLGIFAEPSDPSQSSIEFNIMLKVVDDNGCADASNELKQTIVADGSCNISFDALRLNNKFCEGQTFEVIVDVEPSQGAVFISVQGKLYNENGSSLNSTIRNINGDKSGQFEIKIDEPGNWTLEVTIQDNLACLLTVPEQIEILPKMKIDTTFTVLPDTICSDEITANDRFRIRVSPETEPVIVNYDFDGIERQPIEFNSGIISIPLAEIEDLSKEETHTLNITSIDYQNPQLSDCGLSDVASIEFYLDNCGCEAKYLDDGISIDFNPDALNQIASSAGNLNLCSIEEYQYDYNISNLQIRNDDLLTFIISDEEAQPANIVTSITEVKGNVIETNNGLIKLDAYLQLAEFGEVLYVRPAIIRDGCLRLSDVASNLIYFPNPDINLQSDKSEFCLNEINASIRVIDNNMNGMGLIDTFEFNLEFENGLATADIIRDVIIDEDNSDSIKLVSLNQSNFSNGDLVNLTGIFEYQFENEELVCTDIADIVLTINDKTGLDPKEEFIQWWPGNIFACSVDGPDINYRWGKNEDTIPMARERFYFTGLSNDDFINDQNSPKYGQLRDNQVNYWVDVWKDGLEECALRLYYNGDGFQPRGELGASEQEAIKVQPNPNKGQFEIVLYETLKNVDLIMVFDTKGKLIFELPGEQVLPVNELDMPGIEKGLYMVSLIRKDGSIETTKFIIH